MMDVKSYLGQIRELETKIRHKKEQIEYLRSAAEGAGAIRYDIEKVQTSVMGSNLEKNVAELVDLSFEVESDVIRLGKLRDKIIEQILQLHDERYVDILFKRYVEIKQFNVIAEEMHYSYGYIRQIHKNALEEFNILHNLTF